MTNLYFGGNMDYAKEITQTPQSEPIPGENQVKNNAGGMVYEIDRWALLQRFLILGTEGGTYYVGQQKLTVENAQNVIACIKEDGEMVLDDAARVSNEGLAAKNDPAIFVLALVYAYGTKEAKWRAFYIFPKIIRTGTHLFTFVGYIDQLRSWGRSVRRAVASWYGMDYDKLAYQVMKYQNRVGWRHVDVLRMAHARPATDRHGQLFSYLTKGTGKNLGEFVDACHEVQCTSLADQCALILKYNLPREVIPTESLGNVSIWESLLQKMPLTAMVRSLGRMSSLGLLHKANLDAVSLVESRLHDEDYVRKSRLHPVAILNALKVYAQGHGDRGSLSWEPVQRVVDALDNAFYLSFKNVHPSGKRIVLALDVSGSMGWNGIAGLALNAREASAAMALVTANVESNYAVMGFTHRLEPIDISPKMTIGEAIQRVSGLPFGGTDCAQPMLWALNLRAEFDAFFVYTDNETWAGSIHPSQALQRYRQALVPDARLGVIGMSATNFSIADPKDPRQLDVVGFSAETPRILSQFASE